MRKQKRKEQQTKDVATQQPVAKTEREPVPGKTAAKEGIVTSRALGTGAGMRAGRDYQTR